MNTPASAIVMLLATIGLTSSASASAIAPIYSVTDLGTSYQLQAGAGGQDYAVAGSNGVAYAFDKSSVTSIYERTNTPEGHADSYYVFTMRNGSHQVGYIFDYSYNYAGNRPTFEPYGNGWDSIGQSPVLDINKGGQVVGGSLNLVLGSKDPSSYAAFSNVNGQSHGFAAQTVDNLNNYIPTISGVNLTSAMKIDDLGRIIAQGSNGDVYLLTPTALGSPEAVPEPTTLALLALASAGVVARRWLSRRA